MDALDGNAAAGALSEIFSLELTGARGRCGSCGNVAVLAEALAFMDAPGVVLRCRACEHELVVLVRADDRYVLSVSGLAWLELRAR
jgi:uncharacterized protein (DUF983 family)